MSDGRLTASERHGEALGNGHSTNDRIAGQTSLLEDEIPRLAEITPGLREEMRFTPPPKRMPQTRRDSVLRRSLAGADVLALLLSYATVWAVAPPDVTFESRLGLLFVIPLWVLLNKITGLYDRDPHVINTSTLDEVPRIVQSIALGAALVFLLGPPVLGEEMGRAQTIVFIIAACVITPLLRAETRAIARRLGPPQRCLILGTENVAQLVARRLQNHREFGVEVIGFVDKAGDSAARGAAVMATGLPVLGSVDNFELICRTHHVERAVIGFVALPHEDLLRVIRTCKKLDVKISVVPRLFEAIGHSVEIDAIQGMTLMGLRGLHFTRSSLLLKRTIDVVGTSVGLLLISPLLLAIALAVKFSSPGPVLFRQLRIGRDTTPFLMLKFRTMFQDAEARREELEHLNEASYPMFKIVDDPRITRVGRFLRRTSLDELPQLWNVLRGEMSLVGPRPLIPAEDDYVVGWHRSRLELTPGLTGPWQVMGRTAIPFEEMVKIDYLYVAEWSLWNDVKLLLRTARVMLRRSGA